MSTRTRIILLFLMLLTSITAYTTPQVKRGDTYPWLIETRTDLNVRSGPGKKYDKLGVLKKGAKVYALNQSTDYWVEIPYQGQRAYVCTEYIEFLYQVTPQSVYGKENQPKEKKSSLFSHEGGNVWDSLYEIVKTLLWICAIIIILGGVFDAEWGGPALLLQIICGIGALIGWLFFSNAKAGAVVGMSFGILLVVRQVLTLLDVNLGGIGGLTYLIWYLISLPFYILDLLQFWLAKPWRPFMKRNTLPDKAKPGMRRFLSILQIPFYIAVFPLRLINAVYYNLVIHNLYEVSNYVLEVAAPSDGKEGGNGFWTWLLYLPFRIVKYLIYHGGLTFIESVIWTIIDTFIPAVTLYHGTAEHSADSMLCDPKRNKLRKDSSGWLSGIWNVGGGNYAGDGIYFGIFRKTLRNYQNGSAIVARVTMGKTIDVVLMPNYVYDQAGHPNASAVSNWGLNHGYVSGEWWRSDRNTHWWEICMYDRQNRYNDSWRIRPIYAINSDTGIMQRISGGTAHWLFRKMVINDLLKSIKHIFR